MRTTRTYATLGVSPFAFGHIVDQLAKAGGQEDRFLLPEGLIELSGIAIQADPTLDYQRAVDDPTLAEAIADLETVLAKPRAPVAVTAERNAASIRTVLDRLYMASRVTSDPEYGPWGRIPPAKRFGRRLTADAVEILKVGTILRMYSEDPWADDYPTGPRNGELVVFTGEVSNAFPEVGPHIVVAALGGGVYPGGGYQVRLFQFVSDPLPPLGGSVPELDDDDRERLIAALSAGAGGRIMAVASQSRPVVEVAPFARPDPAPVVEIRFPSEARAEYPEIPEADGFLTPLAALGRGPAAPLWKDLPPLDSGEIYASTHDPRDPQPVLLVLNARGETIRKIRPSLGGPGRYEVENVPAVPATLSGTRAETVFLDEADRWDDGEKWLAARRAEGIEPATPDPVEESAVEPKVVPVIFDGVELWISPGWTLGSDLRERLCVPWGHRFAKKAAEFEFPVVIADAGQVNVRAGDVFSLVSNDGKVA